MEKHLGELPQVRGRRVTKRGSGAKAPRGAGVDFQGRSALRQDTFKVFKVPFPLRCACGLRTWVQVWGFVPSPQGCGSECGKGGSRNPWDCALPENRKISGLQPGRKGSRALETVGVPAQPDLRMRVSSHLRVSWFAPHPASGSGLRHQMVSSRETLTSGSFFSSENKWCRPCRPGAHRNLPASAWQAGIKGERHHTWPCLFI